MNCYHCNTELTLESTNIVDDNVDYQVKTFSCSNENCGCETVVHYPQSNFPESE